MSVPDHFVCFGSGGNAMVTDSEGAPEKKKFSPLNFGKGKPEFELRMCCSQSTNKSKSCFVALALLDKNFKPRKDLFLESQFLEGSSTKTVLEIKKPDASDDESSPFIIEVKKFERKDKGGRLVFGANRVLQHKCTIKYNKKDKDFVGHFGDKDNPVYLCGLRAGTQKDAEGNFDLAFKGEQNDEDSEPGEGGNPCKYCECKNYRVKRGSGFISFVIYTLLVDTKRSPRNQAAEETNQQRQSIYQGRRLDFDDDTENGVEADPLPLEKKTNGPPPPDPTPEEVKEHVDGVQKKQNHLRNQAQKIREKATAAIEEGQAAINKGQAGLKEADQLDAQAKKLENQKQDFLDGWCSIC